jgi:hypoxanthine phosphoribosyltransferase
VTVPSSVTTVLGREDRVDGGVTLNDSTGGAKPDPEGEALHSTILFDQVEVEKRVGELADALLARYDDSPLFVCLMRGGVPFSSALMRTIARNDPSFHPELDYMTVSAYGPERELGEPRIVFDVGPDKNLRGRDVVLLDDIIDTGTSASVCHKHLVEVHGANSCEAVVLVRRMSRKTHLYAPILSGFEVETDAWLTGMGLDDSQLAPEANRWLPYIAVAGAVQER